MNRKIEVYNARVNTEPVADPAVKDNMYNMYYGIELEGEIDSRCLFLREHMRKLSPDNKKRFLAHDEHKNTPAAYLVAEAISPTVEKFCLIKRDGSLKNGLEIVSRPMGLTVHQKSWGKFCESAKQVGLKGLATCGMHVHASRENLLPLQIGKILNFLHNPDNASFIKLIAGRIPPKKYASLDGARKITEVKKHKERYTGLNLTGGQTIEFRIFKGTFKEKTILKNIEFCASLIAFAAPSVSSIRDNNLQKYVEYVDKNRKLYPNLHTFLVDRAIIDCD